MRTPLPALAVASSWLVVACTITVAPPGVTPTPKGSAKVTTTASPSPGAKATPRASQPPLVPRGDLRSEGTILVYKDTGGGPCPSNVDCGAGTTTVHRDGSFTITTPFGTSTGQLPGAAMDTLARAIASADFAVLDDHHGCLRPADAGIASYTFAWAGDQTQLDDCARNAHLDAPLFRALDALLEPLAHQRPKAPVPPIEASPVAQRTPVPSPVAARSPVPTPTKAVPNILAPDKPLLRVVTSGGMCVGGPCGDTLTIGQDGLVASGKQKSGPGRVDQALLDALTAEIARADFAAIEAVPFTDICPTAYDGGKAVYTFALTTGAHALDTCKVKLDLDSPLFKAVNAVVTAANKLLLPAEPFVPQG